MGKGRAKPHLQRQVEGVKVPDFLRWISVILSKTRSRDSSLAALSTKSDEHAYLAALCTAFVKRMANAKAVVKDPEPALKLLADKIALRASADGPRKTAPQAPPVATLLVAKASERLGEDASERRSAKARDLNPPLVPHVIPVPRAADKENEPSSASGPVDTDHGAVTITRRSARQPRLRAVLMTERIRVANGVCRQAGKKFNEFVVSATVGLGLEQCPEQPSLFRRPGTTLIFELHQDDFYVSESNVELAWLRENLEQGSS